MSIRVQDITYSYSSDVGLRFDLDIAIGKFSAIVGNSGSGKSTLIQLVSGLLYPFSGKLIWGRRELTSNSTKQALNRWQRQFGLLFQYPEQQLFAESVFEDIAFGPRNLGLDEAQVNSRVLEVISLLEICENFLDRSPFELSGGEKRLVAIAGILAMMPKVVLLDEPTVGLDPIKKAILFKALGALSDLGSTIIWVTHNMDEVLEYADEVHVVHQGQSLYSGTPSSLFNRIDLLQKAGLDLPQSYKLIHRLKKYNINIDTDINIDVFSLAREITKFRR